MVLVMRSCFECWDGLMKWLNCVSGRFGFWEVFQESVLWFRIIIVFSGQFDLFDFGIVVVGVECGEFYILMYFVNVEGFGIGWLFLIRLLMCR